MTRHRAKQFQSLWPKHRSQHRRVTSSRNPRARSTPRSWIGVLQQALKVQATQTRTSRRSPCPGTWLTKEEPKSPRWEANLTTSGDRGCPGPRLVLLSRQVSARGLQHGQAAMVAISRACPAAVEASRGESGLLHRAARLLRGIPRFFRMWCLLNDEEGQAGATTLLVLDRWSQSEARRTACELSALSEHQTRSVIGYTGIVPWPHWLEGNPPSACQEALLLS